MPTIYKLTDQAMQTHRGYQWTLGEPRQTSGGGDLCSRGWLHAYTDPLLAVLLNPIHANFSDPRLFKGTGTRECREDNGLKVGYTSIVLTEEMPLPEVTLEQRVRFAILDGLSFLQALFFGLIAPNRDDVICLIGDCPTAFVVILCRFVVICWRLFDVMHQMNVHARITRN